MGEFCEFFWNFGLVIFVSNLLIFDILGMFVIIILMGLDGDGIGIFKYFMRLEFLGCL